MSRTLLEYNRRDANLRTYKVEEVLPEYFQESYPSLVSFLSTYYEAMYDYSSNTAIGIIPNLFALRDLDEIDLKYIDRLFYEIASNSESSYFSNPRLIGKFFHQLIQNKGNEYSSQMFFRAFFGEAPEIIYPKASLFTTNVSKLNGEHVIQNGLKWQILSILIKSGRSFVEWETLYRSLVHSAGYYLSGEVATESVATMTATNEEYYVSIGDSALAAMPLSIVDSNAAVITYELSLGQIPSSAIGELHLELDSDNIVFLQNTDDVSLFSDITIENIEAQYDDLSEMVKYGSPTFDEVDSASDKTITMSNTVESMDEELMPLTYNADSA